MDSSIPKYQAINMLDEWKGGLFQGWENVQSTQFCSTLSSIWAANLVVFICGYVSNWSVTYWGFQILVEIYFEFCQFLKSDLFSLAEEEVVHM